MTPSLCVRRPAKTFVLAATGLLLLEANMLAQPTSA